MTDSLSRLRGNFPEVRLTARRVAAVVEAPGCDRRTILDGAGVDTTKLAGLITGRLDRQSPQAMSRAAQFQRVLDDHEHAQILALARQHLGLELNEVRKRNMADTADGAQIGIRETLRARMTRQEIRRILDGDAAAYNMLVSPVTPLQVGHRTAWLEQDALAFAEAGHLSLVMVKTFDYLDGEADPAKVGQATREAAVHVLSLQELAEDLGFDRDRVGTRILLILPSGLTFRPAGLILDVSHQIARLQRRLAMVPDVEALAERLDIDGALPEYGSRTDASEGLAQQARDVVERLPYRFGDGCQQCPMFRICRDEAQDARSTARLGSTVAGACGEVASVDEALALAHGEHAPASTSEQALASMLQRASAAHERALEAA